ncbi:hypothetical protein FQZ97_890730 [compost metagenome]
MLAVDVDQAVGQGLELRHRGCAAIDPGAAAALGVHRAAQQQAVLHRKTLFFQPGCQGGGRVELGSDLAARSAFAHHAAFGPGTQRQLQRVDQDGLARTGLAREHAKALAQFQVEGLNDDEVAQGNAAEAHDGCRVL